MQSAGQGGCPVPTFFEQEVIKMRTSALFVAKNIEFFKIYRVSTRVGLNLNFESDSAQNFLMNLNLNFGFSKTMNLNVKFKNSLNFPNQVVIL